MRTALRVITLSVALLAAQLTSSIAQTGKTIGILLAAGDVAFCEGEGDDGKGAEKTGQIIKEQIELAKQTQPETPVRVLALGDLGYPDGTAGQLDCFKKKWGFYDVLLPVPGNHEYKGDHEGTPYFDHFKDLSFITENGPNTGYYAVNFPGSDGPWRLIGLNAYVGGTAKGEQEDEKRRQAMKRQIDWLEKKIDTADPANRQRCVLAFWHPPIFSSGRHGHKPYKPTKPGLPLTQEGTMRKAFGILHQHKASVVLAGHDHNYEQFSPQDAHGNPASDGIRSFVVGTGGSPLTQAYYTKLARNSETLFGRDSEKVPGREKGTQGVLKIELFEDGYRWSFVAVDKKERKLKTTEAACNTRQ